MKQIDNCIALISILFSLTAGAQEHVAVTAVNPQDKILIDNFKYHIKNKKRLKVAFFRVYLATTLVA